MTYQELQDVDNVIVGSPDTVTRKLSNIIERLNPAISTSTATRAI